MFLENLNEPEKRAFLHLAHHLVHADGIFSSDERDVLAQIQVAVGAVEPAAELPIETAVGAFGSRRARVSVLLELMALCHADDNYHPSEQQLISRLADEFGVDGEELAGFESWVIRQVMLMREAENFWSGEE